MAKIIPIIRKPEPVEYTWFGHHCACYTYRLRGDGKIVCKECKEVIGSWQLDDDK